ncbi:MAG: carboxypeptidase-like regulatory domain-containing protein [Balneolaceae bacterium]|nr:carboxypeptidase-like regulatory domain-containing protein [Balneolaceae bacterium]
MSSFLIKKLAAVVFLIIISPVYLSAQTITGTVLDVETKEPLGGANISITSTDRGTTSAADGTFSLEISQKAETLTISYVGYSTKKVEPEQNMTIYLSPTISLEEVVIQAVRADTDAPDSTKYCETKGA